MRLRPDAQQVAGPVDEKLADLRQAIGSAAQLQSVAEEDSQRSPKWCCTWAYAFHPDDFHHKTLNTIGVLAVTACWSAALAAGGAVSHMSVTKGGC